MEKIIKIEDIHFISTKVAEDIWNKYFLYQTLVYQPTYSNLSDYYTVKKSA